MSAVKWETLLNDVMPHLPGCEVAIAIHHIKRSAIEFCERSLYYRAEADPIDVAAGEREIGIDAPVTGTVVVKVLDAYFGDQELIHKTVDVLNVEQPDWRTAQGAPRFFTQLSPEALVFAPGPVAAGQLRMTVAMAPTYESSGIERYIPQHFTEGIAAGAVGRLMAMQKKPWTNGEFAGAFFERFQREITAAAAAADRSFCRAPLRTVRCP